MARFDDRGYCVRSWVLSLDAEYVRHLGLISLEDDVVRVGDFV